jgi:hypothetical protein
LRHLIFYLKTSGASEPPKSGHEFDLASGEKRQGNRRLEKAGAIKKQTVIKKIRLWEV